MGSKKPICQVVLFIQLFKYLAFFPLVVWERVKLEPPKEGNQRLILESLGISHPLERLIKIIIKFG